MNQNAKFSWKINWMKLLLYLNILLKIPHIPCTGECGFQNVNTYDKRTPEIETT
jgi:hypothetical protein